MEETKKSRNDQGGNSKMAIKIGGGGGGGIIGAVVLLGGALATAAFASAFFLGQKRRSSGQNSSPEKSHDQISEGDEEEVELEKDSAVVISAHSLKVDVEAISEDGFVIVKPSSEIPLLAEKEEKQSTDVVEGDEIDDDDDDDDDESEMQFREGGEKIDDKNVDIEVMKEKKNEFVVLCNGNEEINEEKSVVNGCIVSNEAEAGKEEVISSGDVEIVKHVENDEEEALVQDVEQDPVEDGNEGVGLVHSLDRKGDYSSKWEALWQAEWPAVGPQRVKLVSYETGGKVLEDKAALRKGYEVEMGVVKDDDDQRNSTRLRVAVWALSVVSSLSCSWLLDLSGAKLCLVAFLTVFLLEIYGYPLINRGRPRKGESGFEARH